MSAQPTTENKSIGETIVKIIVLLMGVIGLVGLPIAAYMIAQLIAYHMAFSDVSNGYAFGGLMAVLYNATHVSQYGQMAQILPAFGNTMAVNDVSTIELLGLILGLLVDVPLAVVVYRLYKEI